MTDPRLDVDSVAQQVGAHGVDKLITDAEKICVYEQQRIRYTNEPAIVRLEGELAILSAEQRHIAEKLALAPAVGSLRRLRIKRFFYWIIIVVLAVAGFFSTMLAFAPFRLGWMSWLVSTGMAVLTPYLFDRWLENPGMEKARKVLTAVAATSSLASLMLLALIRGDLLAQQIRESEAQVVIMDDAPVQPQSPNTFYDQATILLSVALLLMAFATEIGGGLVLHDLWRAMPDDSEDWAKLRRELVEIRGRMAEIVSSITALRNAPQAFEACFWRDFYRALLLGATHSAMTKLLLIFAALLFLVVPAVRAEDRLNLVIAIDLTRSVAAAGPDGKTDFEKNLEGVSRVLAQVPAGSRVTVIGITDHSFSQPYILIRAQVAPDPGYFGERLNAAHSQLVRAWQQRAAHLSPDFRQTDIFGAFELASQLFAQGSDASRKELVIFSDMRESVPGIDFEQVKLAPEFAAIAAQCGVLPNLRDVHVYVAGVDGVGKPTAYWQSLQRFWRNYFQNAGAVVENFTILREVPLFQNVQREESVR